MDRRRFIERATVTTPVRPPACTSIRRGISLACELGGRQVTADDLKGNLSVLVEEFDGKRLNGPNDLWIDPKGGIYFSDPIYGGRGA